MEECRWSESGHEESNEFAILAGTARELTEQARNLSIPDRIRLAQENLGYDRRRKSNA